MSTRHRWADVITAWANGEAIQSKSETMSGWPREWRDTYPSDENGTPAWNHPNYRWRIKPRMCSLNGYEFPAPERVAPEDGSVYWTPCDKSIVKLLSRWVWEGDSIDRALLSHARVHLSKDAAIAHARAEILAVGGTLEDES